MRVSSNAINSVDLRFVMEAKKGPRIVIAKRYNERSLCRVKQEVKPRKTNTTTGTSKNLKLSRSVKLQIGLNLNCATSAKFWKR